MNPVHMKWSMRTPSERGSAVWFVGDQHLIAWGDLRPSTEGYALTVSWPLRQGVPDVPHSIEVVRWGAEHVVVTSDHRDLHQARDRANDIIRGIHKMVVEAERARLLAALAELDDQSSDAIRGGTSATGASG